MHDTRCALGHENDAAPVQRVPDRSMRIAVGPAGEENAGAGREKRGRFLSQLVVEKVAAVDQRSRHCAVLQARDRCQGLSLAASAHQPGGRRGGG